MAVVSAKPALRLHFVTGLRGIACLIVVVLHGGSAAFEGFSPYVRGMAKTGVWLFFVLSAFLLTRKLLGSAGQPRGVRLTSYLITRFLRIYPIYAFALVVYYALGTQAVPDWNTVWQSLLLQAGPKHFWTIPPEFKFYLLLPLLIPPMVWLRDRGQSYLLGALR